MFTAIISLLAILLVIRGVFAVVSRFAHWLDEGPQLQRLVDQGLLDEDRVESEQAAELRAFVEECDEWRRDNRLGKRSRDDRPRLTLEQRKFVRRIKREARDEYLDTMQLNGYHVVTIFLVASVLGLIIEEVWCYVTAGLTESRVGLVWGPFSPLYGFGAVFMTVIFWELRKRKAPWWAIFVGGMIVGGLLEQITGWGMETFLGASSWDYTNVPGCITKWVAWPFLFFWGALGLFWAKAVMPWMLYRIGMPSTVRQVVFVLLLAIYLACDITMTVICFGRMARRDEGIPPSGPFEEWVDEHYSDSFIAGRFQNMVIAGKDEG